ncbi:MAG: UDP phosphate-alpha-4-amino-4-deoxy-L-arabinose arabinosyl transferase [Rhodoferax sp.]
MKQASPAIVTQDAVRRLPRWAMWLFCLAYSLPGLVARSPWKREDLTTLGVVLEIVQGGSNAWNPSLAGQAVDTGAVLPYALGAAIVGLTQPLVPPESAVRGLALLLLWVTLTATWYASYALARLPQAQPVAFAFGGEAQPVDYARAIADAAVLALIASLGLAQRSHEATPAQMQLCATAVAYLGMAYLHHKPRKAALAITVGLTTLCLSGAPWLATVLPLAAALHLARQPLQNARRVAHWRILGLIGVGLAMALLAWALGLWRDRLNHPLLGNMAHWESMGRLFLWFTWPLWPMVLWTLWRWRALWILGSQRSTHLWLPLLFLIVLALATLSTGGADRSLLLALPALATLAAFALPTLQRSVSALIDWFTLLFFTGCAAVIWIVWISLALGWPSQPARNVARLLPGFVPSHSGWALAIAVLASAAWAILVLWRVGRHRPALWKSLVLPAGGAALSWCLLMTLWLPMLDYARSYRPWIDQVRQVVPESADCVVVSGLSPAQRAALRIDTRWRLVSPEFNGACSWALVSLETPDPRLDLNTPAPWERAATTRHPAERKDSVAVLRRVTADPTAPTPPDTQESSTQNASHAPPRSQ